MFRKIFRKQIEKIKELKQEQNKYLQDLYGVGIYNGLELALSILENREPQLIIKLETEQKTEQEKEEGRTIMSGIRRRSG